MTKTILFLCPHGAAKSVMAKAYFQKLADQKGLAVRSNAAGPDPEDVTYPVIVELLAKEGLDVSNHKPRKVSATDLSQASRIVSIGCDLNDLPQTDKLIETWNEVPMVSQDPEGSWRQIKNRVESLIAELEI
jgi:protein-tyrosine-phosphatase